MNTDVFNKISYGVYVVSVMDGERPTGCIANSVMQVTASPATIAVSIHHDNFTNECIRKTNKFAISILSEKSAPSIIGTFGYKSGRSINKFDKVSYEMMENLPVVKDSCGYVICNVINQMETETHTVFLGEVIAGDVFDNSGRSMTYAYYHEVIKGKSPKNAPTYISDKDTKKKANTSKYVCQVCGYVYIGDTLPADFICPVCGASAEFFRKVSDDA